MAAGSPSIGVIGCTGLVGSNIITTLTSLASQPTIHAIARKPLTTSSINLKPVIEADSSKWSEHIKSLSPQPNIFMSALGTTKGQAGSFEAQRKIDYDLNLSLAQAAKELGVKVYVLISSGGVSKKSLFPYGRMKAELEEAVVALNFPHTVILKPGLLVGTRADSRPSEAAIRSVARGVGSISKSLTDFWAQDAEIVGRAAIAAATLCSEGQREEGVWVINQGEIVRLGRTEWKDNSR
ncbi:Protein fmp52, mitochondrial [Lecanora helva]